MAKNQLQHFCQITQIDLPVYKSHESGPPHKRTWISNVTISDLGVFHGSPCSTKKEAEASAASKFLEWNKEPPLSKEKIYTQPKIMVSVPTAMLVDVENLPKLISQLPVFAGKMTIYAFVGKHHHLASADYNERVVRIISPSTRPDGTDTCIQVYAGKFLASDTYDLYLIATRDHFGASLVDIIRSDAKKAEMVSSVEHVLEAIASVRTD
jgi:hypothetical protein